MQRYLAFLSGIPLAGNNGMRDLGKAFMHLGFSNVETFPATGNVTFGSAPVEVTRLLEAQISRYLKKTFGESMDVFLRTPDQLSQIVGYEPFAQSLAEDGGSVFVVLLQEPINDRIHRQLRYARTEYDEFHVHGREIYWLRRAGKGSVRPTPAIGEILGKPATVRTLNGLKRLTCPQGEKSTATESARSRP